jgi:hypothetical protein
MEKKKIERGIKFLGKFSNAGRSVGGGGRQTDGKALEEERQLEMEENLCVCVFL